jgi:hypothetical protein
MLDRQPVRDFYQRIIGWIDTDTITGDQIGRDFYQRIVGYYIKKFNETQDFYKRPRYKGNMLAALIQEAEDANKKR